MNRTRATPSRSPRNPTAGDSSALSRLLAVGDEVDGGWSLQDQREMIDHLLGSPVATFIGASPGLGRRSLLDLLSSTSAPVNVLARIKDEAKGGRSRRLPRNVAVTIYYLTVAAAHRCRASGVSRLRADDVRTGLSWILAQSWIGERTRNLAATLLASLKTPP